MRVVTLIIFVAVVCVSVVLAGSNKKKPLKKYTINLDLAPEKRFVEVVQDHKYYIKLMVQALGLLFRGDAVDQFLEAADKGLDVEQRRELQGASSAIGVTWRHALMAHYFYELSGLSDDLPEEWGAVGTRACTGIVAQNSNGTVMLSRNQDYPPPFSPLQYDGIFMKNGTVLYEATTFAGIIGVGGTCMVPGKFVGEINARGSNKPSVPDALAAAERGDLGLPMMLRRGCEQASTFEGAVKFYSETSLIDGGYVTLAGTSAGEGAVLSRNATAGDVDVVRLDEGLPSEDPWFLVQTNYDHWEEDPASDNRRTSAICLMEEIGPDNVDLDALWNVMSDNGKGTCKGERGVYNGATIHTELTIPATGEYHTYLRHNIIEAVV